MNIGTWRQRVLAWLRNLRVGGKLFLFSTILLGLFLILSSALLSVAGSRFAAERGNDNLVVGERVLSQVLAQQQNTLHQGAQVLAADFGFREALASSDAETIASALLSQASRIDATVAIALDLEGRVISSTEPQMVDGSEDVFTTLLQRAAAGQETGGIAFLGGHPLELIIVPVKAPLPIGWVVLGFALDNAAVTKVADLVALDVSVLAQTKEGWRLQATSLKRDPRRIEALARQAVQARARNILLEMGDETYQLRIMPLTTADGSHVVAVLQQSFASAMAPYRRLLLLLIALLVVSFLVATASSRWLAGLLSRPLAQLTEKAEAIARGHYGEPLPVQRRDEIGQLAASVNAMSVAIAEREQEITHRAYYDTLTQLPNRQMIMLLGEQALARAESEGRALALLTMDIERFRTVNDTLGYATGDKLIRQVGERLRDIFREADAVARPGGNQFHALVQFSDTLDLAHYQQRLDAAFAVPFEIDGNAVDVLLTIGMALYPEHGRTMVELMRNAEIALAVAKRERRGIVPYRPLLEQNRQTHLTLLSELKRAVERDELVMFLQPKVNVKTGEVTSAEALVRWQHPERGFVPPGEFIPFAEQTGRIGLLTRWMLAKAMQQTRLWAESGNPLQISVNISARDVLDENFPASLTQLLEQQQGRAEWLRLEITESGLMDNAERALETLQQLRDLGFSLSIDDFGTGYSSLAYLKRMPVAELKIDRSFVQGARPDTDAAVLLRSTIDLGHNLALSVVAEGVETLEEWQVLRDLGCDYIQGYLASRPLSLPDFQRWRMEKSPFFPETELQARQG